MSHDLVNIPASIYGLHKLYGEKTGHFRIFKHGVTHPLGYLQHILLKEYPDCTLTINIKPNHPFTKDQSLYLMVDSKFELMAKFDIISSADPTIDQSYQLVLKSIELGTSIIGLLKYNGIVQLDDIPKIYTLQNIYKCTNNLHTDYNIPKYINKVALSRLCDIRPIVNNDPIGAIDIGGDNVSISYIFNINSKKSLYQLEIDKINAVPSHALYPEVICGKRAMLTDGKCKSWGCTFTGNADEIKSHLQSSPQCNYIDNYASSHSKLAAKSNTLYCRSNMPSETRARALCLRKTIINDNKVSHDIYICNSGLCNFKSDSLDIVMHHYRLLGCQLQCKFLNTYFTDGCISNTSTTEAENRKWMIESLDKSLLQSSDYLSVFKNTMESRIDHVDDFITIFTDPDNLCKICYTTRANIVNINCKHVDICDICLGVYDSKLCLSCLAPIHNYIIANPDKIINPL